MSTIGEGSLEEASYRAAFDAAPAGVMFVDITTMQALRVNDALCAMLGRTRAELLEMNLLDLVHPAYEAASVAQMDAVLTGGAEHLDVEYEYIHPDGTVRWMHISGRVVRDLDADEPRFGLVHVADVTEQKRAAESLAQSEYRFRTLVENIADTVTLVDRQGHVIATSGLPTEILGQPVEDWAGRSVLDVLHPDDVAEATAMLGHVRSRPRAEAHGELRARHADGTWRHIDVTAANLLDDGAVKGIVLTTRDVTARRGAELLLEAQNRLLEQIARGAPLAEVLQGVVGVLEERIDGAMCSIQVVVDDAFEVLAAPRVPAAVVEALHGMLASPDCGTCGAAVHSGRVEVASDFATDARFAGMGGLLEGEGVRSIWSAPVLASATGRPIATICTFLPTDAGPTPRDLALLDVICRLAAIAIERAATERRLEHQAVHDSLTGLPNRTLLLDRLDHALARCERLSVGMAVLFVDLDRFKIVNDSLGHRSGDEVLVQFAQRLRDLVRPGDTVARFGGDEFVVLCEDIREPTVALHVADRVAQSMVTPLSVTGTTSTAEATDLYLTVSIGIAMARDGDTAETLLRDADAAMYRAKERGRDRVELFDDALRERAVRRLRVESDLRRALDRDQLTLHYQPEVDLTTGAVCGVEAFLRWNHPERGVLAPAEFMRVAEETGLIVPIGRWVIDEAIRQTAAWSDADLTERPLHLSVNVAARELIAPYLSDAVESALRQHALAPESLTLEVNETGLIDDIETTTDVLSKMRVLGVHLALDDFGTGLSSLSYLHQLPIDRVKIDRAFVAGLGADPDALAIATAVVNMARALGVGAAAEGVETATQHAAVHDLGCESAQGHYYCQPLPAARLGEFLATSPRW